MFAVFTGPKQTPQITVLIAQKKLIMIRPRLERYRKYFIDYFEDFVIAAEFDESQQLIVYANPYREFDQTVMEICEGLFDTVDFPDRLLLYLYPFGRNEYIRIAVNPIN